MFNDLLADMINRINISYSINIDYVFVFYSKFLFNVLNILKNEGYLKDFFLLFFNKKKYLLIYLKYFNNKPVIQIFKKVSKLSFRVYKSCKHLPCVMNGLGISILTTTKGLLTDKNARILGIGGELICHVF